MTDKWPLCEVASFVQAAMSGGDTVGQPALALIFTFFAVVVGCLFTFILSRVDFQLPYTVWVFLFGILISRIAIAQIENGSNDADKEYGAVDEY